MHSKIDQDRDQTDERKKMHAKIDQVREQTVKRKVMHSKIDKVRDQSKKRKFMHSKIDKVRDQSKKRKFMHSKIDKARDQTDQRKAREQIEERKYYTKVRHNLRYQKKMYETFDTDTGFDVICSSCLQYKNMQYCKPVSILSKEKQTKLIVKYCSILKNRSKDQFVCNLCLKDIKKNKVPKRSHRSAFKFANFPRYLIQNLKKICQIRGNDSSDSLILDQENQDRQALKLNRLESYLLKLVIPFKRIAHCPRGSYLKLLYCS